MTQVESIGVDLRKLEATLADTRSAVIALIHEFVPRDWASRPDAIATLELAKLTLTPKQRVRINRLLANRRP